MEYMREYKAFLACEETKIPRFAVTCPDDVSRLMTDQCHMDRFITEEVWVLTLNVKGVVTGMQMVSKGGIASAICEPRSIFLPAILAGAASVIAVHNHPSGDCSPSKQDIELTQQLYESGKILGIPVMDHMIIGPEGNYFSFKEEGLLN